MAKKNLYINDIDLGDYGIYITSDTVLDAPSFDYSEFSVPGRNGTLLQYNNRLNNVVRKFTCYVPKGTDTADAIGNVKKLIYSNPGYLKIASDYEPDFYQLGYLAQDIQAKPFDNYQTLEFDLYFSCLPYKYTNGEEYAFSIDPESIRGQLVPRNNSIIQGMLNDIDPDDVPSDQAFLFVYVAQYSTVIPITDITVTLSSGGFVGVIGYDQDSNYFDISVGSYYEMGGYSLTGSVNIAEMTDAEAYSLAIVLPADSIGTLSVNYKRNGTSHSDSYALNYKDVVTGNLMMGASFLYEIYAQPTTAPSLNCSPTVYLKGKLGNEVKWESVFYFIQHVKIPSKYYMPEGIQYSIDSSTMQIKMLYTDYDTHEDIETNCSMIEVFGIPEGECDTVEIYCYSPNDTGAITGISVTPRWWTI